MEKRGVKRLLILKSDQARRRFFPVVGFCGAVWLVLLNCADFSAL